MLEFYTAYLAVPAARTQEDPQAVRGRALFQQIGCASCHVPAHITAADGDHPLLSEQQIFPYTDLLLHDMGEGLADGHREFAAQGRRMAHRAPVGNRPDDKGQRQRVLSARWPGAYPAGSDPLA